MKELLFDLAHQVRTALAPSFAGLLRTAVNDESGDPHFAIDEIAEAAVARSLKKASLQLAYYSEARGLQKLCDSPDYLLIVDPIDGTRPAMAGFESCCFSAAIVPYSSSPRYGDITHAIITELKSGESFYAGIDESQVLTPPQLPIKPSHKTDLDTLFWSIELTAHPVNALMKAYGHLIDSSVRKGAVFVFTSSAYSLTRLVTGQLDAHVDIGHRLLLDDPSLLPQFEKVGGGKVVCLYPYDIAAAAFIAERAGIIVTDAYGESLENLVLTGDKSLHAQLSLIAASNLTLHQKLLQNIQFSHREDTPYARVSI